jgi:hypothetical protein
MEQHDREAMRRAVETLLQTEPEWRDQIAAMLQSQPWEEVGLFAATCCQIKVLALKPHECAPAETHDVAEPSDVYSYRASEVRLLRQMLSLGVSRFDPDPIAAIAAAEAKPAA